MFFLFGNLSNTTTQRVLQLHWKEATCKCLYEFLQGECFQNHLGRDGETTKKGLASWRISRAQGLAGPTHHLLQRGQLGIRSLSQDLVDRSAVGESLGLQEYVEYICRSVSHSTKASRMPQTSSPRGTIRTRTPVKRLLQGTDRRSFLAIFGGTLAGITPLQHGTLGRDTLSIYACLRVCYIDVMLSEAVCQCGCF